MACGRPRWCNSLCLPMAPIQIQAKKCAAAVTADRADALLAIDDRVHALVRAHIGVKCRTFGHILHNIHSDQARLLVIGPADC